MSKPENIKQTVKSYCENNKTSGITSEQMDKKIIQNAIAAYKKTNQANNLTGKWRCIMKHKLTKLAAAAVIIIALIFAMNQNGVTPDGASIAWADVVQKLNNYEKYKCRERVVRENGPKHPTMDVYHINLSLRRQEVEDGSIHVIDMQNEDAVTVELNPNTMKATVTKLLGFGPKKDPDIIDMVKRFDQESTERLGTKEVNGKKLYGFRHKPNEHNDFTVWVDSISKLPVEIELKHPTAGQTIFLDEFEFDFEYNPADFSTEVPEGYDVKTIISDYRPSGPKEVNPSYIKSKINHTAYTVGKLEWINKTIHIETTDPLGSKNKNYLTGIKTNDNNIIILVQGDYYDADIMTWLKDQDLILETNNGRKIKTHPRGKDYARYFLEGFAKDMPDFAEFEISDQRQTRMIAMPNGAVVGTVANMPIAEDKLKALAESLTAIDTDK